MPEVPKRTTADYDAYRAHVRAQLAHYPTLAAAELFEPSPAHFQLTSASGHLRKLELVWPDLTPWDGVADAALHPFSDENSSTVTVWPTLPGDETGLGGGRPATHPFLLWWVVLYVAAHFVRYEPERWAQLVDVDSSDEAVALEEIGDLALDAVPELIHKILVRSEPQ